MYVTLRRYAEVGARMYEIRARKVEQGMVPLLKGQPGFQKADVRFCCGRDADSTSWKVKISGQNGGAR
jgi:hypothetical protein